MGLARRRVHKVVVAVWLFLLCGLRVQSKLSGVDLSSMAVATASPVTALSFFASRASFSHFARTLCETTSPSVSDAFWVCSLYGGAPVVASRDRDRLSISGVKCRFGDLSESLVLVRRVRFAWDYGHPSTCLVSWLTR